MFKRTARQALKFHGEKTELVERMVFQRIGGHLRLAQIAFRETVTVYDENAVGFQVRDVDLQCRWIHGDQYINGVAGSGHVIGRKMQLEAAYTRQRSRGCADLSRVIRERADVVAVQRYGICELAAGNLHAVARIACKADYRAVDNFWFGLRERQCN